MKTAAGLACVLAVSLTAACSIVLQAPDGMDGLDIVVSKRGADAGAPPDGGASPTPVERPAAPATCASLAQNTGVDSAFQVGMPGGAGISPVEVFAYERSVTMIAPPDSPSVYLRQLVIGLSETRHVCQYRENGLSPMSMNERRITVSRVAPVAAVPEIGAGTYSAATATATAAGGLGMEWESGQSCTPPPPPGTPIVGGISTATGGNALTGVVTITERTASRIKGSFDVTTPDGKVYTATFDAPLCSDPAVPSTAITCCAEPHGAASP
jgi:hypothetical protein